MPRNSAISVPTSLACALLGVTMACASAADSPAGLVVAVTPASLPRIATVDSRYQSYNVEMAEVIGGNFWKPYDAASIATMKAKAAASAKGTPSAGVAGEDPTMFQKRSPIDLANPRLRKLAAASGVEYAIIQKITSGVKDPQFSTLTAIAEGLDISVSALIHHYEQVTDFQVKQALLEKARKSRSKKA